MMARHWRLYRPAEPTRGVITAVLLFLVYAGLLYFGVALGRDVDDNAVFWPANGVVVAAILLLPPRLGMAFAAACLTVNIAANDFTGIALGRNLVYSGLNTALAYATAFLTRTFCGAATDLSRFKRLAQFAILAFAVTLVEAVIGSAFKTVLWGGGFDAHGLWTWMLCDGLGLLLATPAVLLAVKSRRAIYSTAATNAEKVALFLGVLVLTIASFSQHAMPTFLLIYPLLVLIAFRAGAPWVSVCVMTLALPAIALTVRGHGPIALFAPSLPFRNEELLQLFLASAFVSALPATNALGERNRTAARLARSHAAARAAKARAEAAADAKARFLAVMSHEIRTPLNGVIGFSKLLSERADLAPDARRQIELILGSSNILLALVNDVLDFSKIEARKFELNLCPARIEPLVEEIVAITRPSAEAKGLSLDVEIALDREQAYMADDLRLKQVLLNLVNNAVKFTARGGVEIRIQAEPQAEDRDLISFHVLDTGIGVSDEQRARLFQPFSQADGSITRSYGGTGLGLAICKSLIEMMGGDIGVEHRPDGGSDFWFTVPLARMAEADHAADAGHAAPEQGLRVLVADDHPVNREVASLVLGAAGCEVETVVDGAAAVAAAKHAPYDVILMDIHMPVMDGYAAARAIRRLKGQRGATPIIAMTAAVSAEDVAAARAAGMDGHVAKPLDHRKLMQTICEVLVAVDEPPKDRSVA